VLNKCSFYLTFILLYTFGVSQGAAWIRVDRSGIIAVAWLGPCMYSPALISREERLERTGGCKMNISRGGSRTFFRMYNFSRGRGERGKVRYTRTHSHTHMCEAHLTLQHSQYQHHSYSYLCCQLVQQRKCYKLTTIPIANTHTHTHTHTKNVCTPRLPYLRCQLLRQKPLRHCGQLVQQRTCKVGGRSAQQSHSQRRGGEQCLLLNLLRGLALGALRQEVDGCHEACCVCMCVRARECVRPEVHVWFTLASGSSL
jgi:hypothetical protein